MHAVVFVSSSFTGYKNVTREIVNVCRYCVSDPLVFAGSIFVTREFGVENIDEGLQISYNLCNLPKQITAANGTSVKYSYFADGTKFKAVNAAGNGFAYTGSLRWSVQNGVLTPESVAITGGRALYNDVDEPWSVNYYITDHLGSVRAVTDADGEVLDTYDYMPYGSEFTSDTDNITDYRFTGKEKQLMFGNSNVYDSFARFQNTYGRFMSIDPKAEEFYHISPYAYCAGDPVNMVDPDGEATKAIITAYKYSKRLVKLYKKYGKITPKTLKDAGLSELVDIAGDLHTIFSGDTTFGDKAGALADLIIGTEFNNKGEKAGREFFNSIISKSDDVPSSGLYIKPENKIDRSLVNPPTKRGNAPTFKSDGTSVEIHHRKDGELQEMHMYDHRGGENFKKNHEHISGKSTIDRKKFNKDRREYWNNEFPTNTD